MQDELQTRYTGGTVLHLFTGEKNIPPATAQKLIKKITETFRLPYVTISPTFSICPSHGYLQGEQFECPDCKAECEVYSRIVGYMRPVKQWNAGKQQEFEDRKTFKLCTPNFETKENTKSGTPKCKPIHEVKPESRNDDIIRTTSFASSQQCFNNKPNKHESTHDEK